MIFSLGVDDWIGLDWIGLVEGDLGGGMGDRLYCTYRWKIWVMDDKIPRYDTGNEGYEHEHELAVVGILYCIVR